MICYYTYFGHIFRFSLIPRQGATFLSATISDRKSYLNQFRQKILSEQVFQLPQQLYAYPCLRQPPYSFHITFTFCSALKILQKFYDTKLFFTRKFLHYCRTTKNTQIFLVKFVLGGQNIKKIFKKWDFVRFSPPDPHERI